MPITVDVRIRRLPGNDLPIPEYAREDDSGLDLRSADDVVVRPKERVAVGTGFAVEIPPGFEGQVRMRSGLARDHGLVVPNAPGTIDSPFRGELKVLVMNLGVEPFHVERGLRIAQLVIAPVARARLVEVEDLSESSRGTGGFGHTGLR